MLKNVNCVTECLKIYFEQSGDKITQNIICNGWKHGQYVGNEFVLERNDIVIDCAINVPA